jgi:hypothetical protein
MSIPRCRKFIQDADAGVAVAFVALLPAFLFLTFFIFEVLIALLWVGTVEKAAQLGARLAIVSSVAVTGLPATNAKASGHNYGELCSAGACGSTGTGFDPKWCIGGTAGFCDSGNCTGAAVPCFQVIVNRMRNVAGLIQPQNVTITYEYAGLGFAGGPIVPRVTVAVGITPATFIPPNAGAAVPYAKPARS